MNKQKAPMKKKMVVIELTERQADTLWLLLQGVMCRSQFTPSVMRKVSNIGKRLAAAMGATWRWK